MKRLTDRYSRELAGEYVLGTLHGAARRRFEKLLQQNAEYRQAVTEWEAIMDEIRVSVPDRKPPETIWPAIEARINSNRTAPVSWFRRFRAGWVFLMLALLAPAIYMAIPRHQAPAYQAMMKHGDQLAMVIEIDRLQHITIENRLPMRLTSQQSMELWLLPGGSAKPVSLGVIAGPGPRMIAVPARLRAEISPHAQLAVSMEPAGGSPTGQPTGPVMFIGALQIAS